MLKVNYSLASKYHPSLVEKEEVWSYLKNIYNNSSSSALLMPPPNITGKLHLGHALDLVLQDFLVRYSYLNDESIYWISGIDHAGIATQKKIESLSNLYNLKTIEQKKNYTLNTWYPQVKQNFFKQWKKLGLFVDCEKTKFTLDLSIQKQVKQAFIKLYKDGLIYQDRKIVNWDPQLKSVISDIEVENRSSENKLYYLKYPLVKKNPDEKKHIFFQVARVIIKNKKGDILLVKDKKWGWNLPGGKASENEDMKETAKRETLEETNLCIDKKNLKELRKKILVFDDHTSEVFIYRLDNENYQGKIGNIKEKNILEINFFKENSKEVENVFRYFSIEKKNETEKNVFVRAIIQNQKDQILLVKDKKWGWTLPGGKLEKNEILEEAISREVFEETGLFIKKDELAQVRKTIILPFNNQKWEGYFYWTNKYQGKPIIKDEEKEKILEIGFFDKKSKEAKEYSKHFSDKNEWTKILNNQYYKPRDYLLVATSRPETVFADVALFVNPQDNRYENYIGKEAQHPITKKILPILADESVKVDFGSGVLKCTPAHDFVDYELAKKHHLPIISCTDKKGLLNDLAGKWKNHEPQKIREELIKEWKEKDFCVKIENYQTNLRVSQRTGATIEPLLSNQWFLNLPLLIKKIEKNSPDFLTKINFYPSRFHKVIEEWKEKSHEWCISRQLWWGHAVPAYYHKKTREVYVGEALPDQENWERDGDVLDTWFSSGLWPLTALNQQDKFLCPDPQYFPINYLITGSDILFFWVLKMILLGYYFTNQASFKEIYLHGLIRDGKGKKMSKSLGNGIEPEEIIEKYGTDSLRLFLLANNIWGTDLIFEESKIKGAYNFLQKLWSIGNFLCLRLENEELKLIKINELENEINKDKNKEEKIINTWILIKLQELEKYYLKYGKRLETNLLFKKITDFVKENLSSEYLELTKEIEWNIATKNTLLYVYQKILVILYPFIPFITEHLYKKVTKQKILF